MYNPSGVIFFLNLLHWTSRMVPQSLGKYCRSAVLCWQLLVFESPRSLQNNISCSVITFGSQRNPRTPVWQGRQVPERILWSGTSFFSATFANTDGPELRWGSSVLRLCVCVFWLFVHGWFKQHLSCDEVLVESVGLGRWSKEQGGNKLRSHWRRMAVWARRKPPPSPLCSDPAPGKRKRV